MNLESGSFLYSKYKGVLPNCKKSKVFDHGKGVVKGNCVSKVLIVSGKVTLLRG